MSGAPYLDRLASAHLSDRSKPKHQRLLVQPVAVPSLEHAGVLCAFSSTAPKFTRPDGSVTPILKSSVPRQVRAFPRRISKDRKARPLMPASGSVRQPLGIDRVHETFDLGAPDTPSLRLGSRTDGGMSYKALVEMMIG